MVASEGRNEAEAVRRGVTRTGDPMRRAVVEGPLVGQVFLLLVMKSLRPRGNKIFGRSLLYL